MKTPVRHPVRILTPRPLIVALSGDESDNRTWISHAALEPLVCETSPVPQVLGGYRTVRASDLRHAIRAVAQVRNEAQNSGTEQVPILVDLEVVVGRTAADVRDVLIAHYSGDRASSSLHYVGTAAGLRGLIADIYTCQIADGVRLLPVPGSRLAPDLLAELNLEPVACAG